MGAQGRQGRKTPDRRGESPQMSAGESRWRRTSSAGGRVARYRPAHSSRTRCRRGSKPPAPCRGAKIQGLRGWVQRLAPAGSSQQRDVRTPQRDGCCSSSAEHPTARAGYDHQHGEHLAARCRGCRRSTRPRLAARSRGFAASRAEVLRQQHRHDEEGGMVQTAPRQDDDLARSRPSSWQTATLGDREGRAERSLTPPRVVAGRLPRSRSGRLPRKIVI